MWTKDIQPDANFQRGANAGEFFTNVLLNERPPGLDGGPLSDADGPGFVVALLFVVVNFPAHVSEMLSWNWWDEIRPQVAYLTVQVCAVAEAAAETDFSEEHIVRRAQVCDPLTILRENRALGARGQFLRRPCRALARQLRPGRRLPCRAWAAAGTKPGRRRRREAERLLGGDPAACLAPWGSGGLACPGPRGARGRGQL